MPAAGLAKRMRGIPKFLLPANIDYLSLLEIHIDNIKDSFNDIYLPTRPEIVPLIKSLDHNFKNMNILEMDTSTMSETILETLEVSKEDCHLLVMPDTFFLGQQPYLELSQTPEICELACWKIRDEQRGKLGEINFDKDNKITDIIDKDKNTGFEYAWGALTFSNKLVSYIDPEDLHIGYAAKKAVDNGEEITAKVIDGKYFDCGTPKEYLELLEETLIN